MVPIRSDAASACSSTAAPGNGHRSPGSDATLLLIFNAYHDVVVFRRSTVPGGEHWRCLIDTNIPERSDEPLFAFGDTYQVTGRSLLMFVLQDGSRSAPAE